MPNHLPTSFTNAPTGSPGTTGRSISVDTQGPLVPLYSPNVTTASQRAVLFQKDHLTESNAYQSDANRDYFNRISSPEAGDFRYDHRDFDQNGAMSPKLGGDAIRRRVATHNGSHPAMDYYGDSYQNYYAFTSNRPVKVAVNITAA